ncbi:hypothetical protein D5S17_35515 [Pseudonocardiaceae bacterium YIM PH 21723]|nr:hypothetical protein D5S17_35515 [Pseudonocardiaceae bacterium YIM PH 21723]
MSAIYFHSLDHDDPVVLPLGERARVDGAIRDHFRRTLREPELAGLRRILGLTGAPPVAGLDTDELLILNFWFEGELELGGAERIDLSVLMANTAVAAVPALQALVRLHLGCERHGWVEGPDRAWLADRYTEAVDAGLVRNAADWQPVTALLRESSTGPVATSFYNDFPHREWVVTNGGWPEAAELAEAALEDTAAETEFETQWDAFTRDQQWDRALTALRTQSTTALCWSPDSFAQYRAAPGRAAQDLVADTARLRLIPAL